jgi:SOS response regulatory protein OraA/RecX/phosphopantetheinyl transferase
MKIYVLKKLKDRKYDSEDLLCKVLLEEGLEGYQVKRKEGSRPFLISSCESTPLSVSVSHTKNYWVCALSFRGIVGIDIEELARDINPGIVRMLHPMEQEYLGALPAGSREWKKEFFDLWTRKESFVKALGTGLSEGLSTFSVIDGNGEPAGIVTGKNGQSLYVDNIRLAAALCTGVCTESIQGEPEAVTLKDAGGPLKSAQEQACDLLALREYSSAELIGKLVGKGHSREDACSAADQMAQQGYLDDSRFARLMARRGIEKGKSCYRVMRELKEKGVEEAVARDALIRICEGKSETERAFEQARHLLGEKEGTSSSGNKAAPTEKEIGKVARKLANLGYEPSVIYEIIDRLRR